MSSGELYDFLTRLGYSCYCILHDKNPKAHGLEDDQVMQELSEREPSLLIIPDAGTNNDKECKKLKNKGWEVICLDHHELESGNNNAIVVNCQTSDRVVNKSASGTLVTWHAMHLMDARLANEYASYVAISTISDGMSFLTDENITFILHGLPRVHPNLKALVDSVQKDYYPMSWSFGGFVPKANATIRLGDIVEKRCLFNVVAGIDKEEFDIERVSKIIKHYHTLQNQLASSILEENVTIENEDANVLICKLDIKTSLTGLVANKLMGRTGKSVLMLHDRDDGNCDGSVRSPFEDEDDFRGRLNSSGLFNYNSGHPSSFGTSYKRENEELIKKFFEDFPKPCYTVYKKLTPNQLTTSEIEPFGDLNVLWCSNTNKLVEPKYYIKMTLRADNIDVIGATKTTIKFYDPTSRFQFIKFFCTHEWIDKLKKNKEIVVEMIGTPKWNEYNGRRSPQFLIDRMEFREFGFDDLF